ncbi:hypothetical protein [Dactylosporangium salmoneum]|uniref:Uncharacterized protein n=1 Tax=Dactylosporangium salmoneum TaxID=53361 RepID=A0ABN3HFH3_9ACTN
MSTDTLAVLHASLDGRERPEEIADIILAGFDDLTGRERAVLERAAKHSYRRHGWYSSMYADFARPVGAGRQLSALAHLFERDEADLAHAAVDPAELRLICAGAAESIRLLPGQRSFKHDRLDRGQRATHGIDLPKRQYNRRFRFLTRLAAKIDRLETELRKRELMLVGRSGLAADITADRFAADPVAARFVAYFVARKNLRRQFSLSGRTNPYDKIADVLFQRCLAEPHTDWWMVSRAYPMPDVVSRLTLEERGALLGRWSALMRGAADLLRRSWDPSVDRTTMIVRRGMDSSTWNTVAQAYNTARAGWLNALAACGALDLLDVACPGKVMRLMAADLAAWHRSAGSGVDPDTAVWASLPLPWQVLSGEAACTRETVAAACRTHGVDAEARGWVAPRPTGGVAAFEPTPELVHGVSVADPVWAALLRNAGALSGKKIKPGYVHALAGDIPAGVVTSDLPTRTEL